MTKWVTNEEILHTQILPETGRGTARSVVVGSHGEVCAAVDRWDPSVASRHLPVPGRI